MDKNDRLNDMIRSRFVIASGAMSGKIQKWRNLIELWDLGSRNNLNKKTDERGKKAYTDQGIANVSASLLYNTIETILPRMLGLFDPEGWFSATPRRGTTLDSAYTVESILQQQIEDGNFNEIIGDGLVQALKIGNFVIKIRWEQEQGTIYERKLALSPDGLGVHEEFNPTDGVIFDGPRIDLVPYWNFFPDPKGRTIEECAYVIEDAVQSMDIIDIFVENGYYDKRAVSELKKRIKDSERGSWGDPTTYYDTRYNERDPDRNDVRIIIYQEDHRYIYIAVPFASGALQSDMIILNRNNQDNPYDHRSKQYINFGVNFCEDEPWVKGFIEPLRDNQVIETTFLNMALDALVKIIRPQTIVDEDLGVDIKELMNYIPGRTVVADSGSLNRSMQDKIYEQKPEVNVLNALAGLYSIFTSQDQQISGVTDYITGGAGIGSNKTARGVAMLSRNAETRMTTPMRALAIGAEKLLDMMLSLNQQYGSPSQNIYGEYNFKIFDQATADKSLRMQVLQGMLPVIAQIGGNVHEVVRRILRTADISAIEKILPSDGTMDENQRRQVVGMMIQQQMAGGGGRGAVS